MNNEKGSNLTKIFESFKKKLKDLDVVSTIIYLAFFTLFAFVGLFITAFLTGISIVCILQKESVLAVLILALPTVIVWIFDINNKNITNKSERFDMYLKLQDSIESKYNRLKSEFSKNDIEKNIQIIFNQLDMVEKFIDDLENLKKYTDIDSNLYQIDLFYFFDKVDYYNNEITNNKIDRITIDKKIGKVKTRIIQYILANTPEDTLNEKMYLFTETEIFKYIDFRNVGNLSKLNFEGTPTFKFEYCKIDLNNFSGFLENNIDLTALECRFYKGNKEITSQLDMKELQESFNINVIKPNITTENISENEIVNRRNEDNINNNDITIEGRSINSEDSSARFLDKRSNIALTSFNEVIYFSIEIEQTNYSNGKILKNELANQIKNKLGEKGIDNTDISIRYSKDYSDEPELIGKVKWQSWHSIDLLTHNLKIENYRLKNDSLVIIKSGYAFVTSKIKDKRFHILFFTRKNFETLLGRKIDKNAYTVYKNAQLNYYTKFNFYFAELINKNSK